MKFIHFFALILAIFSFEIRAFESAKLPAEDVYDLPASKPELSQSYGSALKYDSNFFTSETTELFDSSAFENETLIQTLEASLFYYRPVSEDYDYTLNFEINSELPFEFLDDFAFHQMIADFKNFFYFEKMYMVLSFSPMLNFAGMGSLELYNYYLQANFESHLLLNDTNTLMFGLSSSYFEIEDSGFMLVASFSWTRDISWPSEGSYFEAYADLTVRELPQTTGDPETDYVLVVNNSYNEKFLSLLSYFQINEYFSASINLYSSYKTWSDKDEWFEDAESSMIQKKQRRDLLYASAITLSLDLNQNISVYSSTELVKNSSSIGSDNQSDPDYENYNYFRQIYTLGIGASF